MPVKPARPREEVSALRLPAPPAGGWPQTPVSLAAEISGLITDHQLCEEFRTITHAVASKWDAHRWLFSFASSLLAEMRLHTDSTTLKAEQKRLTEIEKAAQKLVRLLNAADPVHALRRRAALGSGLFKQSPISGELEFVDHRLVFDEALRLLANEAAEARLLLSKKASRGGAQKLHARVYGDPITNLCTRCAWLLKQCHGDEGAPVRSGGEGPVANLARSIWFHATGTEPNEGMFDHAARAGAEFVRTQEFWSPHSSAAASEAYVSK